ncbi:hypothetical protein [Chryseobacterium sp. ERMR1:04]|uniref:hypothetical protein n=1 Tax=Chryseobacterium sp. ERMR1:04 TaxID=1705393 RepID=UPI0006C83C52|nr:hypothetical protein [Chryseobacterium sp. ERMR1:04]KPH11295.1 hypothetical protein AMQ68_17880 [Chryseobacterium sp. ERMR1:04]
MINHIIKKNIRLLSERYDHEVSYCENVILLKNSKNIIEINSIVNNDISVKYNVEEGIDEKEILEREIYDLLIKIFRRTKLEKVNLSPSYPLDLDDLEEEFGDLGRFEEKLKSLIKSKIDYSNIGGNRVLTEFYKNILILRDDIGTAKSNVLNIK